MVFVCLQSVYQLGRWVHNFHQYQLGVFLLWFVTFTFYFFNAIHPMQAQLIWSLKHWQDSGKVNTHSATPHHLTHHFRFLFHFFKICISFFQYCFTILLDRSTWIKLAPYSTATLPSIICGLGCTLLSLNGDCSSYQTDTNIYSLIVWIIPKPSSPETNPHLFITAVLFQLQTFSHPMWKIKMTIFPV